MKICVHNCGIVAGLYMCKDQRMGVVGGCISLAFCHLSECSKCQLSCVTDAKEVTEVPDEALPSTPFSFFFCLFTPCHGVQSSPGSNLQPYTAAKVPL